jgi:hypothetical protein
MKNILPYIKALGVVFGFIIGFVLFNFLAVEYPGPLFCALALAMLALVTIGLRKYFFGLALAACISSSANAAPLPTFKHLPGYMVLRQCDPFSCDAVRMLQARGIPARQILFKWSQYGGQQGFHAAVLFQFEGKFYFMDNQRMGARPVAGKTDLGCVNHIAMDFYTQCWMVDRQGRRVAPRKMADLFAPAPAWMKQLQENTK